MKTNISKANGSAVKGISFIKQIVLGILAVAIITFSGCEKKSADSEQNIIKIGAILPLTGPTGYIGVSIRNGLETGLSLYGKKMPIQIIYQDSQGNPTTAVSAYHYLKTTEKVSIIISGGSAVANALLPLSEKDKTLHIATAVATAGFTEQGEHCFRLFLSADVEAKLTARFCLNKLNARRAAILYVNDDFGGSYLKYFSSEFLSGGGKIVFSDGFERKQNDFRNIITKFRQSNADVIYLVSNNDFQGMFIRQIRDAGISTPIVTLLTILKEENIQGAGPSIEGVYYAAADFDPNAPHEYQKTFLKEYNKLYNSQIPDAYTSFSADIMHFICSSIERGGSTASEIERDMRTHEIKGVMGTIKFDDKGDCEFAINVKQIKGGASINVP